MNYWILLKRSCRNLFFVVSIGFFIILGGIMALASLERPNEIELAMGVGVMVVAFLGLGVVGIIRTDICRNSTLMIPDFRKKLVNFYISFGLLMIFILSLTTFFPLPMDNKRLIIDFIDFFSVFGFCLGVYGLSLFIFHFFPQWIAFIWFFPLITGKLNLHFSACFNPPIIKLLAMPFFLIGVILILFYRLAIIHVKEESAFFKAFSSGEGLGTKSWYKQMKRYYSKNSLINLFLINVNRLNLGFLNLLRNLNVSKNIRIFLLLALKNLPIAFPSMIVLFILFIFIKPVPLFFIFMPAIFIWSLVQYGTKNIQIDAVKPISRSRLFLTEYAGIYLEAILIMGIIFIGIKLPITICGKLVPLSEAVSEANLNRPLSPYIFGGLFLIALQFLLANRFRTGSGFILLIGLVTGIVNLFIEFSVSIIKERTLFLLPILLLALTIFFSIISFRLDLKKDII